MANVCILIPGELKRKYSLDCTLLRLSSFNGSWELSRFGLSAAPVLGWVQSIAYSTCGSPLPDSVPVSVCTDEVSWARGEPQSTEQN